VTARGAALVGLASAAAVGWWALESGPDRPTWALALKVAAVLPLAAYVLPGRGRDATRWGGALVGAALVAHSAGDLLIEAGPFLAALAAFAAGHALYAVAFLPARARWEAVGGGAKLRLGLLALAAGLLLPRLLASAPPELGPAIVGYALVLLAMAGLAQVARRGQPLLALGALAYVAADLLLAWHLFVTPLATARGLVWPLYWGGQAAVALGWRRGAKEGGASGAAG